MENQEIDNDDNDSDKELLNNIQDSSMKIIDPNKKSKSDTRKMLIITIIVLIVVIGGFFTWKLFIDASEENIDNESSQETISAQEQSSQSTAELSEEYKSGILLTDFKHPSSWKVSEDNRAIIITSESSEVTDIDGQTQNVVFKIYIKQGATENDGSYLGRGLAIEKSEQIKYSDPATSQREETFITGFGLDSSDNFSYFIVQGNFDLEKDVTLGPNFANELDAILVAGGFQAESSDDQLDFIKTDIESYKQDQRYQTAVEIVKSLQLR